MNGGVFPEVRACVLCRSCARSRSENRLGQVSAFQSLEHLQDMCLLRKRGVQGWRGSSFTTNAPGCIFCGCYEKPREFRVWKVE